VTNRVVLHPRAAPSDRLRVWLGVLLQQDEPKLTWYLDGAAAKPSPVRRLARAYDSYPQPGYIGVMTGVYEFSGLDPETIHRVQVRVGDADYSEVLQARTLPAKLGDEPFRVLLASCFAYETDRTGLASQLVTSLRPQPDLTFLVGDQVYLDQPVFESFTGDEATLAQRFEAKYLANWAIPAGAPTGYARILDAAPSASIPDDHEFWNNFPQISAAVPATIRRNVRESWKNAALAMYGAFQRNDSTTKSEIIDIDPLSFFLMDNRTSRSETNTSTMSAQTLTDFDEWTRRVAGSQAIPVLITGPSIFQDKRSDFAGDALDNNLANYDDFIEIMSRLQLMARSGNPVLLLTGDVHYARILQADLKLTQLTRPGGSMYEVISSPTSLVNMPFRDQWSDAARRVGDILRRKPVPAARWKKASLPGEGKTLAHFSSDLRFDTKYPTERETQRGDHVAVLSFRRTNLGVKLTVTYHAVPKPETEGNRLGDSPVEISLSWALEREGIPHA
jgi:hypothetical protein